MHGVCIDRPRDPVLERTWAELTPAAVLRAMREQWTDLPAERRDAWRSIVALDAAYHPRRHIRMSFAVLADEATPHERYWPEGELVYLHAPVRSPMSRRGRILRLGQVQVEGYLFPEDRRLRGLRKTTSTQFIVDTWRGWLEQTSGGVLHPETLQRRFIRYGPEQKWIARLRAEVTPAGATSSKTSRVAVRCCGPADGARIARRHHEIGTALAGNDRLRVPKLIGASPKQGVMGVKWDKGETLLHALHVDTGLMGAWTNALHDFHAISLRQLPLVSLNHISAATNSYAQEISLVMEDRAAALSEISHLVMDALARESDESPVTLHNDLHLRQILVGPRRLTLLDFERMGLGDPAIDIANFSAQLAVLPVRPDDGVDAATACAWRESFLSQWFAQFGAIPENKLAALTASSLVKLAHASLRHLRPGWRAFVEQCLVMAQKELAPTRRPAEVEAC